MRESKKAKDLWAMKAAWDRCKEYYDPARKEDILGRTKTRLDLWEEHLKDPTAAWQKRWNSRKILFSAGFGSQFVAASRGGCNDLQYCGREDVAKHVGKPLLGRRLALLGSMGRFAFAHIIQLLECPGEILGPHSVLFFFLNRMESVALTKPVPSTIGSRRRDSSM